MVSFIAGLLDATVRASTVLILASLGEIIAERAGVLNLGVEGMMLVGALSGFVVTVITGNPWLGLLVGIILGIAMAAIHAFLTISLKSDQVISGIMLTLLGIGLTTFFGQQWVEHSIEGFQQVTIPIIGPFLVGIPVIGPALFLSTPTDYVALALVPVTWYFLFRTNLGLEITAVGDDPETADTMGVNVFRMRYLCVLLGGAFAGAAGAHLSLAFAQLWVPGMVAGRGWIAVALVIFAQWRPERALVGAYLFGLLDALKLRSQALNLQVGTGFPAADAINAASGFLFHPTIMATYPYIATIAVLAFTVRKAGRKQLGVPGALLQAYSRETD
jgi:simple sugar transport system permease protein